MPRGERRVKPDIAALTMDPTEQLFQVLDRLPTPTARTIFKAPSFSGEEEMELFAKRFEDITTEKGWNYRKTLLHLRGA